MNHTYRVDRKIVQLLDNYNIPRIYVFDIACNFAMHNINKFKEFLKSNREEIKNIENPVVFSVFKTTKQKIEKIKNEINEDVHFYEMVHAIILFFIKYAGELNEYIQIGVSDINN